MDGNLLPVAEAPLPQNTEAEQALLAAILVNNEAYHRVSDIVEAEHFAEPVHQRIFEACGKLIGAGRIANPVTLKNLFDQDGALQPIGGARYLAELFRNVVTTVNAPEYARQIRDCWTRRKIIEACEEASVSARTFDPEAPGEAIVENLEAQLFSLTSAQQRGSEPRRIETSLKAAIQHAERAYQSGGKIMGATTGFPDLDRKLGGLIAPDLIVLAGRPGMGKTELAINISFNVAKSGGTVVVFEQEMGAEQVGQRILARLARVSADRQRRGELMGGDFQDLMAAADEASRLPIWIDETPALSVAKIRSRARRIARKEKLGLLVIDHLQLMRQGGRQEARRLEIGDITSGLKSLAKELSVPVLLLSQLSREVEKRDDKRPILSDLRESGDIEQDADIILFLYRAEYYLAREEPHKKPGEDPGRYNERQAEWEDEMRRVANMADVIIAKQRMGPTGIVQLRFDAGRSLFDSVTKQYEAAL